jgi:hypothetical protein
VACSSTPEPFSLAPTAVGRVPASPKQHPGAELEDVAMTTSEQKVLARGLAAGTIVGVVVGLMIALFIAIRRNCLGV